MTHRRHALSADEPDPDILRDGDERNEAGNHIHEPLLQSSRGESPTRRIPPFSEQTCDPCAPPEAGFNSGRAPSPRMESEGTRKLIEELKGEIRKYDPASLHVAQY